MNFLNNATDEHLGELLHIVAIPGRNVLNMMVVMFRNSGFQEYPVWNPGRDEITCAGDVFRFEQPDWRGELPEDIKLLLLEFCIDPPPLNHYEAAFATKVTTGVSCYGPQRVYLAVTDIRPTPESEFLGVNWPVARVQLGKAYKRICEQHWARLYLTPEEEARSEMEVRHLLQCSPTAHIDHMVYRAVARCHDFDQLTMVDRRLRAAKVIYGFGFGMRVRHISPWIQAVFTKFAHHPHNLDRVGNRFMRSLDYEPVLRPWDTREPKKNEIPIPDAFPLKDMPTYFGQQYLWTGRMRYNRCWWYQAVRDDTVTTDGPVNREYSYGQVTRYGSRCGHNIWHLHPAVAPGPTTQLKSNEVVVHTHVGRYLIKKPREYVQADLLLARLCEKKPKPLFQGFGDLHAELCGLAKQLYQVPDELYANVF
jgi:hypothetical protein